MKIKHKFILIFSFVAVLPLLITGALHYYNAKNALEKQILGGLVAVSDSRISHITHLIQLRHEQAKSLAGTFLIRQLESSGKNNTATIALIQSHIESIHEEMKRDAIRMASSINKPTAIDIIGIWDIEGTIVANTNKELIGQKMPNHYHQIVKEYGTYFAGFQKDPLTGENFLIFLDQIRDYEDGQFAGAVLLKVNPQILNEITTNRAALGETGEVYLVNKDYYMITESRFIENAILNQKVETETAKKCFSGEETLGIYPDYRGISIVGSARYLEDLEWGLFTEVDEEEAFASIYELRNKTLIIGSIVLFIAIGLGHLIAISFTKPIDQLGVVAQKVKAGDLSQRAEGIVGKEMGALATAFNSMMDQMEGWNDELEDKVHQRTSELEIANKELEDFSYSVSHDLRAPLTRLDGFSKVLQTNYKDKLDGKGVHYLDRIRSSSQLMARLIDDLLILSRISRTELKKEVVYLSELTEDLLGALQATDKDRKVKVKIQPDINVTGDAGLMKTMMENLLNNAWKFTAEEELAMIEFGNVLNEGKNWMFLKDNGMGFDMKYYDQLFTPFQSLHSGNYKGSGIGLSTVQRIIKKHGGQIHAESEPRKGTTFYFNI